MHLNHLVGLEDLADPVGLAALEYLLDPEVLLHLVTLVMY
jgi:hypothetical protein